MNNVLFNNLILKIKENYGINVENYELIHNELSVIYKVYTFQKNYILKIMNKKINEKTILKEASVTAFLRAKGLEVSKYVQCLNGKYYLYFNNRIVVMQEYIEGETKEKNTGDKKQLLDSAKYLGMIVEALDDYPYDDMKKYNINIDEKNYYLNKSQQKFEEIIKLAKSNKKYGKLIISDLKEKQNMLNKFLLGNDFAEIEKVSIKKTHGDYTIRQFIYDGDNIKAIIDFVNAAELPITWEIIRSYSYIDKECVNGSFNIDNLVEYTKEYMKYSSLNKYDLKYMPYIYLAQLLNSTFGYVQYLYTGNLSLLQFGIERTNTCRYLINNYKQISEELQKLI